MRGADLSGHGIASQRALEKKRLCRRFEDASDRRLDRLELRFQLTRERTHGAFDEKGLNTSGSKAFRITRLTPLRLSFIGFDREKIDFSFFRIEARVAGTNSPVRRSGRRRTGLEYPP
jgi:hypothetical protein